MPTLSIRMTFGSAPAGFVLPGFAALRSVGTFIPVTGSSGIDFSDKPAKATNLDGQKA